MKLAPFAAVAAVLPLIATPVASAAPSSKPATCSAVAWVGDGATVKLFGDGRNLLMGKDVPKPLRDRGVRVVVSNAETGRAITEPAKSGQTGETVIGKLPTYTCLVVDSASSDAAHIRSGDGPSVAVRVDAVRAEAGNRPVRWLVPSGSYADAVKSTGAVTVIADEDDAQARIAVVAESLPS